MPEHQPPVELPEGYLEFFVQLESWQNEELIRLKRHYHPRTLDLGKLLAREKRPLLQQVEWELDADSFKNLYGNLLDFLEKRRPNSVANPGKIKADLERLDFVALSRDFIQGNDDALLKSASQLKVPLDYFLFTLDHALRPLAGPSPLFALSAVASHISAAWPQKTGNVSCSVTAVSRNGRCVTCIACTAGMISPGI